MKNKELDKMVTRLDDKYLNKMLKLLPMGDKESAHSQADDLLVDIIREIGLNDIADAYEEVGKWYS